MKTNIVLSIVAAAGLVNSAAVGDAHAAQMKRGTDNLQAGMNAHQNKNVARARPQHHEAYVPKVNSRFHMSFGGLKGLSKRATAYLDVNGYITSDQTQAAVFFINQGQLSSNAMLVSANPSDAFIPFASSSTTGSISTTWTATNGLVWTNSSFTYGAGVAKYCQGTNNRVYIILQSSPDFCNPVAASPTPTPAASATASSTGAAVVVSTPSASPSVTPAVSSSTVPSSSALSTSSSTLSSTSTSTSMSSSSPMTTTAPMTSSTAPVLSTPVISVPTSLPSLSAPVSVPTITQASVSLPSVTAPTISVPSITIPSAPVSSVSQASVSVSVPSVSVSVPSVSIPIASVPSVSVPSVTIPSASVPTSILPSASIPTASVPSVSVPLVSIPTASIPTASVPTLSLPSITVPSATVPVISVPSNSVPVISQPTISVASISGPSIPVPTASVPSVSVPSASVPSLSVPSASIPIPPVLTGSSLTVAPSGIPQVTGTVLSASSATGSRTLSVSPSSTPTPFSPVYCIPSVNASSPFYSTSNDTYGVACNSHFPQSLNQLEVDFVGSLAQCSSICSAYRQNITYGCLGTFYNSTSAQCFLQSLLVFISFFPDPLTL